MMEMILPEMII